MIKFTTPKKVPHSRQKLELSLPPRSAMIARKVLRMLAPLLAPPHRRRKKATA
jgi:hypothetical protein